MIHRHPRLWLCNADYERFLRIVAAPIAPVTAASISTSPVTAPVLASCVAGVGAPVLATCVAGVGGAEGVTVVGVGVGGAEGLTVVGVGVGGAEGVTVVGVGVGPGLKDSRVT